MSMMLPPTEAPGLPIPPGGGGPPMPGGGGGMPPMDALSGQPLPDTGGGMAGLLQALGGGGGLGGLEGGSIDDEGGVLESEGEEPKTSVEYIQEAMKNLMMAMASEDDEEHGLGITKGMGALQGILAGKQKKQTQLGALGG